MMILNHYHVGIYTIGLLSNEFEVDVARLTFDLYPWLSHMLWQYYKNL